MSCRPLHAADASSRRAARTSATNFWPRAIIVALFGLSVGASPLRAQLSGDGFLFHSPRVGLTLRGGWDGAAAKGDIFSLVTDTLSLGRNDFRGPFVGLDLAFPVQRQLDIVLSTSYSGTNAKSDYRHLVDLDNLPIEQTTQLQRVPVSAGVRAYLASRGRSVGQFVWIPAKFSPYVGAGGGTMWYRFKQQGDFVDYQTTNIFTDVFESSGWAPMAYAAVGGDYSLTPHLSLNGEAKYNWAKGELGTDFAGFGKIDLSGYTATLGLSVRF